MSTKLPDQGFVFWPVGNGDSTSVVVTKDVVLQVDLNDMAQADDDDDPHTPVVDRLIELLPKVNKVPYLTTFALTHPDQDHCRGFADLLKEVTIGELWFTPRVFREYKCDLCDDAVAFHKEATRRVKKVIAEGGKVASGDRVRIVGYDDLLKEDEFAGFPNDCLTVPGNTVTALDGMDYGSSFRAFVHSPFKEDCDAGRNDTSLGLQVVLVNGKRERSALLLGDLTYPTLKCIFDRSKAPDVAWSVFLAPHHCSKSVMYWKADGDKEESLKQDILDSIEGAMVVPGHIVASSEPIPSTNKPGDNPPHAKAKSRYEELGATFVCTQDHPNEKKPEPIIFAMTGDGLVYEKPKGQRVAAAVPTLAEAVDKARGTGEPPTGRVGFGRRG